jgi:hypothetical protein
MEGMFLRKASLIATAFLVLSKNTINPRSRGTPRKLPVGLNLLIAGTQ